MSYQGEATSMRSSGSIIVSPTELVQKKKDILRRSNDRLQKLAEKSFEYD
jgi:formate dehydrogenase maturation protein FdhE